MKAFVFLVVAVVITIVRLCFEPTVIRQISSVEFEMVGGLMNQPLNQGVEKGTDRNITPVTSGDYTSIKMEANKLSDSVGNVGTAKVKGTGAFIHVGKTGGSTLTRVMRNACHFFLPHPCSVVSNETIVSKEVDHYYHVVDFDSLWKSRDSRFIITLRDAFERTVSAFSYHHPANIKYYRPRLLRGRRERLVAPRAYGTCFSRSLNDFAMLTLPENSTENDIPTAEIDSNRRGGSDQCRYNHTSDPLDVDDSNCSALACAAVRGSVRFFHHLYYNYQFMIRSGVLLDDGLDHNGFPHTIEKVNGSRKSSTLYAVRKSKLWEDWRRINILWGEPESNLSLNNGGVEDLRNITLLKLPIHKSQITEEGRRRLCRAIEPEYRAYFRLMRASINLQSEPDAIPDARRLAKKHCPHLSNWALLLDDDDA